MQQRALSGFEPRAAAASTQPLCMRRVLYQLSYQDATLLCGKKAVALLLQSTSISLTKKFAESSVQSDCSSFVKHLLESIEDGCLTCPSIC